MLAEIQHNKSFLYTFIAGTLILSALSITQILLPTFPSGAFAILAAFICTGMAVWLWQTTEKGEALNAIWRNLSGALIFYALGETTYFASLFVTSSASASLFAVAEICYAVGGLFLVIALYQRLDSLSVRPKQTTGGVNPSTVTFYILVGVLVINLVIVVAQLIAPADSQIFAVVRTSTVVISNASLAILLILIVLTLVGGRLSLPWRWIMSGYLVYFLADVVWLLVILFEVGDPVILLILGLPYTIAYFLILYGLFIQATLQRQLVA